MRVITIVLLFTMLAGAQSPPASWEVNYLSGPVRRPASKVTLRLDGDRLIFETRQKKENLALVSIPGPQITNVIYAPLRFSRAEQVVGDKRGPVANTLLPTNVGGCGTPGCGGYVLLLGIAALIAAPMHGRSHFVTLAWTDSGVDQELTFETHKDNYATLIATLQKFAGVKWLDLEAERKKVEGELAREKEHAVLIVLERAAKLGSYELQPGKYKLIALAREGNKADLYLFESGGQLKAVAKAEAVAEETSAAVEYRPASGQIAAFCAAGKRWKIVGPE